MLLLDNSLLSDYLAGRGAAREFLEGYEAERWAVSTIVLSEAYMGAIHGYIGGSPTQIRQAVSTSMDVLPVTMATADEAASLQGTLRERGVPADHPDALIAASAREHGAVFATADEHFHRDAVQEVLPVATYDPA